MSNALSGYHLSDIRMKLRIVDVMIPNIIKKCKLSSQILASTHFTFHIELLVICLYNLHVYIKDINKK